MQAFNGDTDVSVVTVLLLVLEFRELTVIITVLALSNVAIGANATALKIKKFACLGLPRRHGGHGAWNHGHWWQRTADREIVTYQSISKAMSVRHRHGG
jgi:hypothetical protein